MIKPKVPLLILLLMPLIFVGYLFFPVKFTLKQKDLDALEKPYFLIEWVQITGSSWMIVGDEDGYYDQVAYIVDEKDIQHIKDMGDQGKYIISNGEMPSIVRTDDFTMWHNTYIVYVNYVGERDVGISKTISEYEFTGWDVLYPVKRDGSIIPFLPKSYICKWDFIDDIKLLVNLAKFVISALDRIF